MPIRRKTTRRPPPKTRRPAEPLTDDEVGALLAHCSRRAPTGIRNAALIAVVYRSGLRIGETLALRPADVDLDSLTIRVLHGKGDRSRTVALDPQAAAFVQRWLDARKRRGLTRSAFLFCTLEGKPMDSSYVRHALPRTAARAGIVKRVHAHGLRHTFASELAAEGVSLPHIQTLLGHQHLQTTAVYVHQLRPEAALEVVRGRTWTPRERSQA
jgi:site-specific recombinase XerD